MSPSRSSWPLPAEQKVSDAIERLARRETFEITLQAYTDAGGSLPPRLAEHCAELIAAGPINHGIYALTTGDPQHRAAAAAQLKPARD